MPNIISFTDNFDTHTQKIKFLKLRHGDTAELNARLYSAGAPIDLTNYGLTAYYQPLSAVGTHEWYQIIGTTNGITGKIEWSDTFDMGCPEYRMLWRFESGDDIAYTAAYDIVLMPSPGFDPHTIDPVPLEIDFSKVSTLNAPWVLSSDLPVIDSIVNHLEGLSGDLLIKFPSHQFGYHGFEDAGISAGSITIVNGGGHVKEDDGTPWPPDTSFTEIPVYVPHDQQKADKTDLSNYFQLSSASLLDQRITAAEGGISNLGRNKADKTELERKADISAVNSMIPKIEKTLEQGSEVNVSSNWITETDAGSGSFIKHRFEWNIAEGIFAKVTEIGTDGLYVGEENEGNQTKTVNVTPDGISMVGDEALVEVQNGDYSHSTSIKNDGVYVDSNGYKPMVLSGLTEDDQPVVFSILGYEVQ